MLDNNGFDLWADGYDKAVGISDEDYTYPFAGYRKVLDTIFRTIMTKPGSTVLDLGFGTGILAAKLYENGYTIYGQDFSSRMIELASEKMPGAHLYQGDFTHGLAEPLRGQSYDFIVATYSLHHLDDRQKERFLNCLLKHLNKDGRILIGDIAFKDRAELEHCRKAAGDEWDDEECYFVVGELRRAFPVLSFQKASFCAGILTLSHQFSDCCDDSAFI